MASQSEVSDVTRGVRCQILAWYANEDVVVAEGGFCSSDRDYKIGQIPIGRNAVAVTIKTVLDPDAGVWRPTAEIYTLEDAVGVTIPWLNDKVIVDISANKDESRVNLTSAHIFFDNLTLSLRLLT